MNDHIQHYIQPDQAEAQDPSSFDAYFLFFWKASASYIQLCSAVASKDQLAPTSQQYYDMQLNRDIQGSLPKQFMSVSINLACIA